MMNNKCLIRTYGYFGDIMFASSIAEKIRSKYDTIDYLIGWPQMKRLLQNNPFINNVYVSNPPNSIPYYGIDTSSYTTIFELQPLSFEIPPCVEYQKYVGVDVPSAEYTVYTSEEFDTVANQYVNELKNKYRKPVIAVMNGWNHKTYSFTKEEYDAGNDTPPFGYGGKHRNVSYILDRLSTYFTLLSVGFNGIPQYQTVSVDDLDTNSLLYQASILKMCDGFIGTEGGLANLAAGVGCRTVLTGDYIHQLYGINGCVKKINNPQLGPDKYFKNGKHIMLDPFCTDDDVVNEVIKAYGEL